MMPKSRLDTSIQSEYPALQTIVYHPKVVNAVFGPVFKYLTTKFLSMVDSSKFFFYTRKKPEDLQEFFSDLSSHSDYEILELDVSNGLLVGIAPGNTVVHTWNFNIPIDTKNPTITISIPLGNMVEIFGNQGPDSDGIDFFILLPSADMPKGSQLAIRTIRIFDTPQDSEITFNEFPKVSLR